jgi:hypothetical protein
MLWSREMSELPHVGDGLSDAEASHETERQRTSRVVGDQQALSSSPGTYSPAGRVVAAALIGAFVDNP